MSRTTLRIVIVLAALSIAGITVTQVYWVRKAFNIRENQFNRDVTSALSNVAQRLFEINHTPSPSSSPIEQISTNYFVVLVNGPIDSHVLEFLLVSEFKKRNIVADFEYGIYDCMEQCMVGGNYISPQKTKMISNFPQTPKLKNDGYYFAVQFPGVQANLLSQVGIWGFSSAVMLIVIFFFVYTLFVILKQRRLSEIQKDFVNNMTHELKTPISTIALSSEVLKEPGIVSTPQRLLNYATIIQNENQRLKQHVERVLQMAQFDKEDIVLYKEKTNVHDLIRDSLSKSAISMGSSPGSIELEFNAVDPDLMVDRLHFSNVIINLIDNAIKYNRNIPQIIIATKNLNHYLELCVTDNGIGIPPEHLRSIFHKFFRISTGNIHDVKGFGLGLSYVKTIIERHGGKIKVESIPDKGSTFIILLPVR
ncbi:MAG TPA: HAMP domain-containing sensor histidine kinase [Cyclobacteriaceae bacterium]|nr:HAMP domain-containing sensor histidine kinase [Cyclobacteriaceae bacterium]